jgi:hypothetical protein
MARLQIVPLIVVVVVTIAELVVELVIELAEKADRVIETVSTGLAAVVVVATVKNVLEDMVETVCAVELKSVGKLPYGLLGRLKRDVVVFSTIRLTGTCDDVVDIEGEFVVGTML